MNTRAFETNDLDACRQWVARVFKPHQLNILGSGQTLAARFDHFKIGCISLNRLAYGAPVAIDPGPLESFFLLQIPLTGAANITSDQFKFESNCRIASLISPKPNLAMQWSAQCDQLILHIAASDMQRLAQELYGPDMAVTLAFDPRFEIYKNRRVMRLIDQLVQLYQAHGSALDQAVFSTPFVAALVDAMLAGQPRVGQQAPIRTPKNAGLLVVNDTIGLMLAHPADPHSVASLAAHARIGSRALFSAFAKHRGSSPMAILRDIRLDRVRDTLLQPRPDDNVTRVAMRFGFMHLGRFSEQYRQRFAESPSITLQRSRHLNHAIVDSV